MVHDNHSLFGYSTVASVISQTSDEVVLNVESGEGARFQVDQQVTIWEAGIRPVYSNSMVGRITAISTDQVTVNIQSANREGSGSRTVVAGDQIANTITPKIYDDIYDAIDTLEVDLAALTVTVATKVTGPASATDNAIARFDGTTGKLVQDSNVTISDGGAIFLDGGADEVQLTVQGHSTQTSVLARFENSSGASQFTIGASGNTLLAGYLHVGSTSTPNNTTAGDLTATRLSIGNESLSSDRHVDFALPTSAQTPFNVAGTLTTTASTSAAFASFTNSITPTSNSATNFRALVFSNVVNPASGITFTGGTGIQAGFFENRVRSDGTITSLIGANINPFTIDSSSAATAAATNVTGLIVNLISRPSGTTTPSLTTGIVYDTSFVASSVGLIAGTLIGFRVTNANAGNTITSHVGLDVQSLTRAATNIGVRIAAPSGGATANYALQLSDTTGSSNGGIWWGTDTELYRAAAGRLATTGRLSIGTYLNVGSTSAPSNTSTGDLTAFRLRLRANGAGDGGFGSGAALTAGNVMTNTGSGAVIAYNFANSIAPASNSSSEFRALTFGNNNSSGTLGVTLGTVTAGHFEGLRLGVNQSGSVATTQGINSTGLVLDSGSYLTPTATIVRGGLFGAISRPSGNAYVTSTTVVGLDVGQWGGAGAITSGYMLNMNNPANGFEITTLRGIVIPAMTRATSEGTGIHITMPYSNATSNYGIVLPAATGFFEDTTTTSTQYTLSLGRQTYQQTSGAITGLNATPTAAGSGYSVGDRLLVTSNGSLAEINVDSVDGSGGVTAVSLISGGRGYAVATGRATAYKAGTTGSGSGCTVNVTAIGTGKTITNATTLYIEDAPAASTNVTITNAYALRLGSTTGLPSGGITFSTDVTLYRSAADTLKTDDNFRALSLRVDQTTASSAGLFLLVSGDAQGRFIIKADGGIEWGDGSVTRDVTLYRSAANVLKTDDDLEVADEAYGAGWNGSLEVPTKNAVYDKIESLAGGNPSVTSKTANYTATTSDDVILCDSSGGAFAITLPASSGNSGVVFYIKKTDSSVNGVTIDANASETIDGSTTKVLYSQYEELTIVCDGSNWYII